MLAKPEYSSPPGEVCCWPGCRGGAAGTGSRRKQLAGVPWGSCWYGQLAKAAGRGAVAELLARGNVAKSHREDVAGQGADAEVFLAGCAVAELLLAEAPWKNLPLRGRRCDGAVEELAARRTTMQQPRESAEQHREEAKWQQSALYSIFIPVPQAPYRHSYHNKIQKGRVILLYRE